MKKIIDFLIHGLMPWNVIFGIVGIIVLCAYLVNVAFGYECVVAETGYYHSTNKESKCRFIEDANKKGYTIKRTSQSKAIDNGYKICNECFSKEDQDSYYKLLSLHNHLGNYCHWLHEHMNEDLGWTLLWTKNNIDVDSLYVYIDNKSILHISSICSDLADDGNAKKVKFDDVNSIKATCENCVGREYVDFIYKKIHEGTYDFSLIKWASDDEY